jgi:hypothetical protein
MLLKRLFSNQGGLLLSGQVSPIVFFHFCFDFMTLILKDFPVLMPSHEKPALQTDLFPLFRMQIIPANIP